MKIATLAAVAALALPAAGLAQGSVTTSSSTTTSTSSSQEKGLIATSKPKPVRHKVVHRTKARPKHVEKQTSTTETVSTPSGASQTTTDTSSVKDRK